MRAIVVRRNGHTGCENATPRMIGTKYAGRPHRKVERADSGHYSYKTAHDLFDSLGEILECGLSGAR